MVCAILDLGVKTMAWPNPAAGRTAMLFRTSIGAVALAAAMMSAICGAAAFDESKYPD
jgi:hypothetical protein